MRSSGVTGDQYVFVALASMSKAILSYRVGKRNGANTEAFVADLRERVIGTRPRSGSPGRCSHVRRCFRSRMLELLEPSAE